MLYKRKKLITNHCVLDSSTGEQWIRFLKIGSLRKFLESYQDLNCLYYLKAILRISLSHAMRPGLQSAIFG